MWPYAPKIPILTSNFSKYNVWEKERGDILTTTKKSSQERNQKLDKKPGRKLATDALSEQ